MRIENAYDSMMIIGYERLRFRRPGKPSWCVEVTHRPTPVETFPVVHEERGTGEMQERPKPTRASWRVMVVQARVPARANIGLSRHEPTHWQADVWDAAASDESGT
jgi:hypothetical protein